MTVDQFMRAIVEAARRPIDERKAVERAAALEVAGHLGLVTDLAASDDVAVRRTVVEILRRAAASEPRAARLLYERLEREPDVKTRRRLAAAIGDSGHGDAVRVLSKHLEREEHRFVQASLILALGSLGYSTWSERWLAFLDREGPVADALRKAIGHTSAPASERPLARVDGAYALSIYPGLEPMVDLELRQNGLLAAKAIGSGWVGLTRVAGEALGALAALRTVIADFHIAKSQPVRSDADYASMLDNALASVQAGLGPASAGATFRLAAPRMSTKNAYTKLVTGLSRSVERATGWRNNPSDYIVDLRIVRFGSRAYVVWRTRLWEIPRAGERRLVLPASIHPTVAAGLCLAAVEPSGHGPATDAILLDPACGSGTILREWLGLFPQATAVGFDISKEAVDMARQNLAGLAGRCCVETANMRRLPLDDASVDHVVVNLPFGIRVKHGQANEALYEEFTREAARVLRPGGSLVGYTADRAALARSVRAAGWRTGGPYAVIHAGGLDVAVARVVKT